VYLPEKNLRQVGQYIVRHPLVRPMPTSGAL